MDYKIPKIIHYCWFGGNPLPESVKKCITSWERYFPDFEIKEWNESNYNVHKVAYTSEAYNEKKYAFVTDFVRFDILYNHGGIYFDTDVEVIKSFDDIIRNGPFMGLESNGKVNAGSGMGCDAGLDIINQIINLYSDIHFLNKDGTHNLRTVVDYITEILIQSGMKKNNNIQSVAWLTIYPADYFAPKSSATGKIKITGNTHSIHYYNASWVPENEYAYYKIKRKLCSLFTRPVGTMLSIPFFIIMNISNHGMVNGIRMIARKLFPPQN